MLQLIDIVNHASQRLNEGQTGPVFYPKSELVAAANEAERFFVLLTLCLETTAPWNVPALTTFFHMLAIFPDWICPLYVSTAEGAKIRPSRLDDLSALNLGWLNSPGPVARYCSVGADLVAVYQQPATIGTTLNVKYARSPKPLVNDTDIPEIRPQFHPNLVDYTIYRVRQVEGGLEFEKSLAYLNHFLDAAQSEGDYVRARALSGRYDTRPYELEGYSRSKLLGLRRDLVPNRKAA